MKLIKYRFFAVFQLQILLFFTGFLVFNTSTLHIHILPDGRVIVHSHIASSNEENNGNGSAKHKHSSKEIDEYFVKLSDVKFLKSDINYLAIDIVFIGTNSTNQLNNLAYLHAKLIPTRGPPIFSV